MSAVSDAIFGSKSFEINVAQPSLHFTNTSSQRTTLLTLDEEDVGRHIIIDELRTALRTQPMRYVSIKELKANEKYQLELGRLDFSAPTAALVMSVRFFLIVWGRGVYQDALTM